VTVDDPPAGAVSLERAASESCHLLGAARVRQVVPVCVLLLAGVLPSEAYAVSSRPFHECVVESILSFPKPYKMWRVVDGARNRSRLLFAHSPMRPKRLDD
jgi:hypothetical protein